MQRLNLYIYFLIIIQSIYKMKKLSYSILIITIIATLWLNNVFWLNFWLPETKKQAKLDYPSWKEFSILKDLIEKSFSNWKYTYNCINNWSLCPNPKYTPIKEKLFKLIVASTYKWNEEFYWKLLSNAWFQSWNEKINWIIWKVPASNSSFNTNRYIQSNYAWSLMQSSFWIDFSDSTSSNSSLISAIRDKIEMMKRANCNKANPGDYSACWYWWSEISNIYLPTSAELSKESVYYNRKQTPLSWIRREYLYIITQNENKSEIIPSSKIDEVRNNMNSDLLRLSLKSTGSLSISERLEAEELKYYSWVLDQIETQNDLQSINLIKNSLNKHYATGNWGNSWFFALKYKNQLLDITADYIKQYNANAPTYSVDYRKKTFTMEEAEESLLEAKTRTNSENDKMLSMFSSEKKNYKALLNWKTVNGIPEILKLVPNDVVFAYIRNPQNIFSMLESWQDSLQKISKVEIKNEIKKLMQYYFSIDDFAKIQKNIKNEMIIAVTNLDVSSPDIIFIISEKDKDALSPSWKTQIVTKKNWYIFISPSKKTVEKFTSLKQIDSVCEAFDFKYLWSRKWDSVKDMLIYAWDSFFEKMLSLESYIMHARKLKDFNRLQALQQYVWAYKDLQWKDPADIKEVMEYLTKFWDPKINESDYKRYSLDWEKVVDSQIWSIDDIKPLSEVEYDLSKISRSELENYKSSVLNYKEVWRASLDPMWIAINKFADWIEIDFFMTPIPNVKWELKDLIDIYKWTIKERLAFIDNEKVRSWIFSIVYWFDPDKMSKLISEKQSVQSSVDRFNKEVLNWESVLDYLGWEFAFTLWWIDPDIFEWWNVEKVDAHISIQVKDEEKWKELIEKFRKSLTWRVWQRSWSEGSKLLDLFAKPMIEEYRWKKIYYVSDIPFPFVWKIQLAYSFVNDFLVISINKPTIKKAIDTSIDWDKNKKKLIDKGTALNSTFFWLIFDWIWASKQISDISKKKPEILWSIWEEAKNIVRSSDSDALLSSYYMLQETKKRLWKEDYPFIYDYWFAKMNWKDWELYLSINESETNAFTWSVKKQWEKIKTKIDKWYFTSWWKNIQDLFQWDMLNSIKTISTIYITNKLLSSWEPIFSNTTFTMNLWSDEIWFKARFFKNIWGSDKKSLADIPWGLATTIAIIVSVVLLGFFVLVKFVTKKSAVSPI